jgi:nucleotide-binding universal stress UspA family protein
MRILVGYDGSDHADTAIDDLRRAGLPDKAEAIVLSAVEWPTSQALRSWGMVETDFSPEWVERIGTAQRVAQAGSDRLLKLFPQWEVQLEPSAGNPADAILEKARTWPADLIVVGTHGRSALGRALLGSVSLKLIREAPCSVRVARSSVHDGPVRLLVGTDGSHEADATIEEVCGRFWPTGTEAHIVAVHEVLVPINAERIAIGEELYDTTNEDEYFRLKHAANGAAEKLRSAGLIVTALVEKGEPKHLLVRLARDWKANAIFVGARGLGRVEGILLGSVSSATVAHAPCTVEVVRHQRP